mgnify:CR=1 FL=1
MRKTTSTKAVGRSTHILLFVFLAHVVNLEPIDTDDSCLLFASRVDFDDFEFLYALRVAIVTSNYFIMICSDGIVWR